MSHTRRALGQRGEDIAANHLTEAGLRVVDRNWCCAHGELDIVARDGDALVLVEVRTRRSRRFGPPEASVGRRKQRRLARLATAYVQQTGWPGPWRVDVVAVVIAPSGGVRRVSHYRDAVRGG